MLQNLQVSSISRQDGSVLSPPFLLQSVESRNYDNDSYKDFVIQWFGMNESGYSWVICDNSIWLRITLKRVFPSFWWPIPVVLVLVDFTLKYARTQIRQDPIPKNGNDQKRETGPNFGPTFYVLYLREWHACEFFISFLLWNPSQIFCLSQIFCHGTHWTVHLLWSREIQSTKDDRCQTGEFLPSNQNSNYPLHCFYEYRPLSWSDLPVSQLQIPELSLPVFLPVGHSYDHTAVDSAYTYPVSPITPGLTIHFVRGSVRLYFDNRQAIPHWEVWSLYFFLISLFWQSRNQNIISVYHTL